MKWSPEEIGRFGFKVGHTFEMSWFTLWRRDDHYDLDLFVMGDDDEPTKTTTSVPFDLGDKVITEAYDNGGLESWEGSYNVDTGESDPFTWSLDIAALDESLLFISHGKGGMPDAAQFSQVMAAVRLAAPDFGKEFPEIS